MSYIIHATFINSVGRTVQLYGTHSMSATLADAWLEYLKKEHPDIHHWKECS